MKDKQITAQLNISKEPNLSEDFIKYIFIEDEQAILIVLKDKMIKIPNISYLNKEDAYKNLNFNNCIYVDNDYIESIVNNMMRKIDRLYNLISN